MKVKNLIVKLSTEIKQREIPLFRGAINAILEEGHSILFHNHQDEGFRYSYPLIQYKRIDSKATIVCIQEGTDAIEKFLKGRQEGELQIGKRIVNYKIDNILTQYQEIETSENPQAYQIVQWLPFNQKNYKIYREADNMYEKCKMLEKIAVGNIISMSKGIGYNIEDELYVKIYDIKGTNTTVFKGVKLMAFDIEVVTNIKLPNLWGIGNGVSHGYGIITNL